MAQVVERPARDLEVRGSNSGPGSNFSLGFKDNRLLERTKESRLLDRKKEEKDRK